MHFVNGTLALIFSAMYLFFSLPAVYPTVAVVEVSLTLMKTSGWAYMLLAGVHWFELVQMIQRSLHFRGLAFPSQHNEVMPSHERFRLVAALKTKLKKLERSFWRPWNWLFGVEGICGVNGRYFYVAFLTRETIEVVLQTYQGYQLSGSVRRSWITDLSVAAIVLNSVSTPIVYAFLRRQQESARRFLSILVDMIIDFCCATVIPLCVVYPYISSYDISIGSLPFALTNDDVWFTSSLIEIRQFCVTSIPDFMATMLPQATVFTCLNLAKKIVRRDPGEPTVVDGKRVKPNRISMVIVVTKDPSGVDSMLGSSRLARTVKHSITTQRVHVLFHAIMVIWGAIVLSVHVRAIDHAEVSAAQGCRLSLNAWYATGTPCSVMQINCHRHDFQGSAQDIATILQPLDRSVLRKLIITHCPALEIPPLMGQFSSMTDFDVYNSTLVSWPSEAAATPSTMRSLVNFNWFRSPYVGFPSGLLHNNLPEGFARFSIAHSNMTELPPELGTRWVHTTLDVFSVQFTKLSRLPTSFSELQVRKIRLNSNLLESIDDNALAHKRLTAILLSGNPLKSWPASMGDTTGLMQILAEYTNISNLSAQVERWWNEQPTGLFSHRSLSMYGSPMCDGTDTASLCSEDHGDRDGTYSWDVIDPQRALDK